jgi:hypothetical protein
MLIWLPMYPLRHDIPLPSFFFNSAASGSFSCTVSVLAWYYMRMSGSLVVPS